MALFPYNEDGDAPVDFSTLYKIVDTFYSWALYRDAGFWSEQSDTAYNAIHKITLGLMTMMADSNFMKMLEAVGIETDRQLDLYIKNAIPEELEKLKKLGLV